MKKCGHSQRQSESVRKQLIYEWSQDLSDQCEANEVEKAEKSMQTMWKIGVRVSLGNYTQVVKMYRRLKRPRACMSIARSIAGKGLKIPHQIIEKCVRAAVENYGSDEIDKVTEVLRFFEENAGCCPRSNAWSLVLKNIAWVDAQHARRELSYRLVASRKYTTWYVPPPCTTSYNTLLSSFVKKGQIRNAILLYGEMIALGRCKPGIITFNRLLEAPLHCRRFVFRASFDIDTEPDQIYDEKAEMQKFVDAVENCMERYGVKRDRTTFTVLLRLATKLHSYQNPRHMTKSGKIWSLWKEAKASRQVLDLRYFNVLIHSFARCGDIVGAVSALKAMTETGLKPDLFSYNGVIAAAGRAGHVETAKKFLEIMRKLKGMKPDVYSYCSAITACGRCSPRKPASAEVLLDEAIEDGVRLSGAIINAAITANGDDVDSAVAMWRRIRRKKNVDLDKEAYEGLMYVCGAGGRPGSALKVVYAMRKDGIDGKAVKSLYSSFSRGLRSNGRQHDVDRDFLKKQYVKLLQVECRAVDIELPLNRVRIRY